MATPPKTPLSVLRHYIVGNYYRSLITGGDLGSSLALPANQLNAYAYPIARTATYDRIGIDVATVEAGTFVRLGIYEDDGSGYPGDLLVDGGAVAIAGGAPLIIAVTIDQQLIGGRLYWLAANTDNTGVARFYGSSTNSIAIIGMSTTLRQTNASYSVGLAYAALPDPFTAGATITRPLYAMGLRLASIP